MERMMKMQLHTKKKEEDKTVNSDYNGLKVIDSSRFWKRFESEIDRSELSIVSKSFYLKELISPKVRVIIDGLPFTSVKVTIEQTIS